jgi:hypothetical protein
VFDNAEKGAMVHRLMAGLGAAGVDRVVMMPPPGPRRRRLVADSLRGRRPAKPARPVESARRSAAR